MKDIKRQGLAEKRRRDKQQRRKPTETQIEKKDIETRWVKDKKKDRD